MKKTKTVMVVDDEPDTVISVIEILKSSGFDQMFAYNGKECLSKIKKKQPDLILLDVMMPGITATEVIQEINKDKKLQKIKIIYLTAISASKKEKKRMVSSKNVVGFIEKPIFNLKEFIAKIQKALDK